MKILGMGWIEVVIILAVILIIFGPKQLPKLGKAIGKTVKNLRKGIGEDEETAPEAAAAPTSTEVAIVAVESAPAESATAPQPEPAPAPAPAPETAAAPKVVKKTVVKKKVE